MLDFTMEKYNELIKTILESGYKTETFYSHLNNLATADNQRFVILRHDIDRKPNNALIMAEIEEDMGVQATYYFRYPDTFVPEIINRISSMGHEIGYHYEVLSKANGDYDKAVSLFEKELNEFRKLYDVKTICMHGRPLSKYDNRDLWKVYDFRDFGIQGEAYLSVGNDICYFSDTGRSWNWKNKIRDIMPNNQQKIISDTTDDLIHALSEKTMRNVYILTHPERWSSNITQWTLNYNKDIVFNLGKKVLAGVRG